MSATATQITVKDKFLILSAAKVRALLEGRKTQERIPLRPQPLEVITKGAGMKSPRVTRNLNGHLSWCAKYGDDPTTGKMIYCRHGEIGDRLWVREGLRCDERGMYYDADETRLDKNLIPDNLKRVAEFCDPFHMPRWASRITLEITNVRVERLQEISERDAQAEGARVRDVLYADEPFSAYSYVEQFKLGWDALNAKRGYSWESNPWIWVIEFKKL